MRLFLKKILEKILWLQAKLVLVKYKPKIIGVTGSVGKTSTKEAIFYVLSSKFFCWRNIKSYNNEIGVPLTILGSKTKGKSIWGWLKIIFGGLFLFLSPKKYPEILILEMGVEKPGDMDYLLSLAKPHIAVLTAIAKIPVHIQFFKGLKQLIEEKAKLILGLGKDNIAILNFDNKRTRDLITKTKAKVITFGLKSEAGVFADNITLISSIKEAKPGLTYKLHYKTNVIPVRLPYIFAKHQIYTTLAAACVGIALDMNLVDISSALGKVRSLPGRMNLINGIKNSFIIDDSYNSSPLACTKALSVLDELEIEGKKIACLGDMLELGVFCEEGHRKVGRQAARIADRLVVVGPASRFISDEAKRQGMAEDRIFEFETSQKAGKFIQKEILSQGDLILIKGSQAIRMEKIVKELMARPDEAKDLLVRQEEEWLKK